MIAGIDVPRETMERLRAFVSLLQSENVLQNLVSASSLRDVWDRHIADSLQLVRFAPPKARAWLDLGTGAGFPGLLVPLVCEARVTLVESRKLRADFLQRAAAILAIEDKLEIICGRAEALSPRLFDVISARAFAPLNKIFVIGEPFSASGTVWILPKGRGAKSELDAARASWQGDFRIEPSVTDAEAGIIVATEVRSLPRGRS
jgi:16S rRNA (guanine527-N7)-methyltransferase